MRNITVRIQRYSRERGPFEQTYQVPVEEGEVWSVMDVLRYIYEELDRSLAFFSHAACRQAACGKCLMKINGKAGLACKERADTDLLELAPAGKEVIRDLISR